ncbi:oxygen-independent coproporphyrinogen III oxidase [Tsuneonella mangrovi]|uniref:oxygen-independent coproporphyrinogen III oxidase n=1 Tax=Tsuneonella mangrovi TaxID=1982042 RepID=UPI000BA2563B|nr:oxygen-independent coproporphyrinogen III oxidase [Tsuneonella mangrovi]
MWSYHPDLLATPVPRYTSYPTAAEFGAIEPDAYHHALETVEGDVSLYVHIPFCEKICFYCGCNTGAAGRRQRLESYLAALHHEIAQVALLLPREARVRRIAFGGGSPNAIAPVDFIRLIDTLYIAFGLTDPVISIELDPRTLSADWGEAIGRIGIERASLGVQTFAPHCQQTIGRVQSDALIADAVNLLRKAGVSSLNFDLMYGLPGQSQGDLEQTLVRTCELGADRIALFGYAHVPHIVPRQRAIDASNMPAQDERFAMAQLGYGFLSSRSYVPVGFDHFATIDDPLAKAARGGTLRRNFQGFTDDHATSLIGLGSSAISAFPGLLAQNEKNSGRYRMIASQGRLAADRGVRRSTDDQLRGKLIEQLLCAGHTRVPGRLMGEVADALEPFTARGLARVEGEILSIPPQGLPYARTIAALFDRFRQHSPRRFSSAV